MASSNLIRKQYLMSDENISKVNRLAKKKGTSSAQIVRLAVEAYNPDSELSSIEENELMELVASRLREAIDSTRETRKKLDQTLNKLGIE